MFLEEIGPLTKEKKKLAQYAVKKKQFSFSWNPS